MKKSTTAETERRDAARAKAEQTINALTQGSQAGHLPIQTALAQAFLAGQRFQKEIAT